MEEKDVTKAMLEKVAVDFNKVILEEDSQIKTGKRGGKKTTKEDLTNDILGVVKDIGIETEDVLEFKEETIGVLKALGVKLPDVEEQKEVGEELESKEDPPEEESEKPEVDEESPDLKVPIGDEMQISDVCKMQVKKEIDSCVEKGMSRNSAAKWLAEVLSKELGKDIKPETIRQKDKRARGLAKTKPAKPKKESLKKDVGTSVPKDEAKAPKTPQQEKDFTDEEKIIILAKELVGMLEDVELIESETELYEILETLSNDIAEKLYE